MDPSDFIAPVGGALVAGALIGMEREYRARPAGLRTHILVSLSSALLMLAAVHQTTWFGETPEAIIRIDPVRMAHGVLTGIGFLCGGVIFRERFSVHGLTTAASLWTTSALGMLYGVGFYALAIGGTAVALAVLAGLRWIEAITPQRRVFDVRIAYPAGGGEADAAFQAFVRDLDLRASSVGHHLRPDGGLEIRAVLQGAGAAKVETLSRRLSQDGVVSFSLRPR